MAMPSMTVLAELPEEAFEGMIVGKLIQTRHVEEHARYVRRGRLYVRFHAHADDRGRDLLDDIGKARHLRSLVDANRVGAHRLRSRGHRAKPDRTGNGSSGDRGEKALTEPGRNRRICAHI